MSNIAEDLHGQNFYGWTVKERVYNEEYVGVHWKVFCNCGKCNEEQTVSARNLKRGTFKKICENQNETININKSIEVERLKNEKEINLQNRYNGKMFGNFLVIAYNSRGKNGLLYDVECQCENKTKLTIYGHEFTSGKRDSCGCLTKAKKSLSSKKYSTYDLSGEYGVGYTIKGDVFYFDLEDYDLIKNYCWNLHGDGRGHDYLVARAIDGTSKEVRMHRLIMNAQKGEYVDHIYHNTNDNRKSQLRITTNQQNCFNHKLHSHNTHGNKGLTQRENGKWRARIWINYKTIDLGTYDTIEEAKFAREQAEIKYHKEYKYEE